MHSSESKPAAPSPEAPAPLKGAPPVRDDQVGLRLLLFFIFAVLIIVGAIAFDRWG